MPEISDLVKYAINYLSKYSSSKTNLERILKNKIRRTKIDKKEKFILYKSIPEILKKLEKNNFINDYNYATSKINLFISNGKSKIFIQNYLFKKGIDEKLSSEIFEELNEEDSNWEIKSARTFARKKNLQKNNNNEKNLSKMARAGFNYEIAKKILDEN
tara:strand:+ start:244 stop:720 length:477 start_codon:yes stop_codon:yes gene_type:complete